MLLNAHAANLNFAEETFHSDFQTAKDLVK